MAGSTSVSESKRLPLCSCARSRKSDELGCVGWSHVDTEYMPQVVHMGETQVTSYCVSLQISFTGEHHKIEVSLEGCLREHLMALRPFP